MDKIDTKEKTEVTSDTKTENLSESEQKDLDIKTILNKQPHLSSQSYDSLNGDITPLTFEIMSRQATINIGTLTKSLI